MTPGCPPGVTPAESMPFANPRWPALRVACADSFRQIRMIPRPLDVEDAPHVVDLALISWVASSRVSRLCHQCQRHGTGSVHYLDVNRRYLPYRGFQFRGPEVVRFGPFSFAEHQEGVPGSALADPATQRSPPAMSAMGPFSHLAITRPRDEPKGPSDAYLVDFRDGTEPTLEVGPLQIQ